MRRWRLSYELCCNFSAFVRDHSFVLRCFPYQHANVVIRNLECAIIPRPRSAWSVDSFGNTLLTGYFLRECVFFKVRVTCDVEISYAQGLLEARPGYALGLFRTQSALTRPQHNLREFIDGIELDPALPPFRRAEALMRLLYGRFRYVSGSTTVKYGAEQAFAQGCGVCQDYAHILLSLCRAHKLCARYVAGAIPGEGQSHAWVEILSDGLWHGLDPTHNRICTDSYLAFSVGRDALDCALNRGTFRGQAQQRQYVSVVMKEL